MFTFQPISYLRSPFTFKNGTPRQPTVCSQARGVITIEKTVFNNPEHSLEGLEAFTHVWIMFVFHKNNNTYTKAKVKPPRLNGRKMGLFSTRSPYRPNNIGLTLAKIESVIGSTLTVSGIDILDGTPILDIKPYISQYDNPGTSGTTLDENMATMDETPLNDTDDTSLTRTQLQKCDLVDTSEEFGSHTNDNREQIENASDNGISKQVFTTIKNENSEKTDDNVFDSFQEVGQMNEETTKLISVPSDDLKHELVEADSKELKEEYGYGTMVTSFPENEQKKSDNDDLNILPSSKDECNTNITNEKCLTKAGMTINRSSVTESASWIAQPPIPTLNVRFTPTVEEQLQLFTTTTKGSELYRLKYLKSHHEAREAILNILHEDPRSTYRRKHCVDSLYYFTIDVIHVTCWFDENNVEVVRVKPAALVEQCKEQFLV